MVTKNNPENARQESELFMVWQVSVPITSALSYNPEAEMK